MLEKLIRVLSLPWFKHRASRMTVAAVLGLALPLAAGSACGEEAGSNQSGWSATATAWPEASQMFRRDARWLGGDDAYSVDLGGGRVAWFFGDSFVAPTTPGQRRGTTMVRNSVGLQTGYDPANATFEAFWREVDGKPQSFVAEDGKDFFWPGGPLLVDGKLMMFMMRARDANRELNFETTGWGAVLIDNIAARPDRWHVRKLDAPQNRFGVLVGSASLVRDGDHLIAFSVGDKAHNVYLVRWPLDAAANGDLSQPQWWTGEGGWVAQSTLTELPPPVITGGQTEFTVHFSPPLGEYVQIQFAGFPVSPIGYRTARALTGPWSELSEFHLPNEIPADTQGLMLYAAKAHLEQTTEGLALTYCSNMFSLERLIDSPDVYYPRFLKLTFERTTPAPAR